MLVPRGLRGGRSAGRGVAKSTRSTSSHLDRYSLKAPRLRYAEEGRPSETISKPVSVSKLGACAAESATRRAGDFCCAAYLQILQQRGPGLDQPEHGPLVAGRVADPAAHGIRLAGAILQVLRQSQTVAPAAWPRSSARRDEVSAPRHGPFPPLPRGRGCGAP